MAAIDEWAAATYAAIQAALAEMDEAKAAGLTEYPTNQECLTTAYALLSVVAAPPAS